MSADSIAGASFLADPALKRVMTALNGAGETARIVGGAVRNSLIGEPVDDIDIATTARPETVIARVRAAGLKAVPTGIDHGTVTVVASGRPFEVTTLRADVETDGRRAVVAFSRDWVEDAERRDFTMNAVYADLDGRLTDPVGGVADALARHVRFIGDPERRISEDFLRILRFFRFHARYGVGAPDGPGLEAAVRLQDGLDRLSRERIGAETGKLVLAANAPAVVGVMEKTGILDHVLSGGGDSARFATVVDLCRRYSVPEDFELSLVALAREPAQLAADLRLANRQSRRAEAIVAWSNAFGGRPAAVQLREAVYRAGNTVATAALLLGAASHHVDPSPEQVSWVRAFTPPRFPLTAARLIDSGMTPGPALGAELRRQEGLWLAAGCPAIWPAV